MIGKENKRNNNLGRHREAAARKMRRRREMMWAHGQQGGLLYEKHRRKIDRSLGYMRDGNVSHYVSVGFRPKTKDRNRYGSARRLSRHDKRLEAAAIVSQEAMHDKLVFLSEFSGESPWDDHTDDYGNYAQKI